jgi:hypothetical protein
MKTTLYLFSILLFFPITGNSMSSGMAVLNEYGSMIAIARQGTIQVYALPELKLLRTISNEEELSVYEDQQKEVVDEVLFARDNHTLLWYQNGHFYALDLIDPKSKPVEWNNDSFVKQSWFSFSLNGTGDKIVSTEMGNTNPSGGISPCSPHYRGATVLAKGKKLNYLKAPKSCEFVSMVDCDKEGNVVFDIQGDGVYYYAKNSDQAKKIAGSRFRLYRNCISGDGKTILMNGRMPLNEDMKALRDSKIEIALKNKFNHFIKDAAEAERYGVDWSEFKKEKEWLHFCYGNDSAYTILAAYQVDGVWQQPVQIVPPHLNAIAWGITLSDDGKHVCWMDLQRGEDGNTITRTVFRVMSKSNGTWQAPKDVFSMTQYDNTGGRNSFMIAGDYLLVYYMGRCRIISGLTSGKFRIRELY